MSQLIRRIDGKTGEAEWHTLHEWNIINGYEKPDEIIPFIEVIDGEVVKEKSHLITQQPTSFSIGAKMARSRAVARWSMYVSSNPNKFGGRR